MFNTNNFLKIRLKYLAFLAVIDCLYYDIVNTVHGCVRKYIPVKKHSERSIVGWNENVKHYHVIARSEFNFWKQNNMPRRGSIFRAISTARARFTSKYALKQCRLDEQIIRSNKLANYMQFHDLNNFWKEIEELRRKNRQLHFSCFV